MKIWAVLDDDGRILSYVDNEAYKEGESVEIETDSVPDNAYDYVYRDGEFVLSPPETTESEKQAAFEQARSAQMMTALTLFVQTASLTDEQALTISNFYDEWSDTATYAADDIVRYDGLLWRCRQAHTAQADWYPGAAPSLWGQIVEPGTIPEFQQPQPGIFDGYTKGQRVTFEGKTYESIYDGLNVWSPSAYPAGWVVVA